MRKLNYLLSTLPLTVMTIFCCQNYASGSPPLFLMEKPSTEAQSESQNLKQPPKKPIETGSRVRWEELKTPPREDPPTGSRGDLCPITPGVPGKTNTIWSDRPLFLWQGEVGKIEVHPRHSEEVLWSQSFERSENSSAIYGGKALQPGQSYDAAIFDKDAGLMFAVSFQVLPKEERDRITDNLTRKEVQLKQNRATPEEIAYAKAQVFAERQMWADVLQSAYEVKEPSEALTKFKQKITALFCPIPTHE